jgi:hypothetical protein
MVKSEGEQPKSDGVVVPLMAGRNPVGGKAPTLITLAKRVSARAWPGPPGPITPTGLLLSIACDDCDASYGLRPSSLRSGVSTPCSTGSTGVTSWRRRGSESGAPDGPTNGTPTWFHDQGLHQLMGTIGYPKAA